MSFLFFGLKADEGGSECWCVLPIPIPVPTPSTARPKHLNCHMCSDTQDSDTDPPGSTGRSEQRKRCRQVGPPCSPPAEKPPRKPAGARALNRLAPRKQSQMRWCETETVVSPSEARNGTITSLNYYQPGSPNVRVFSQLLNKLITS